MLFARVRRTIEERRLLRRGDHVVVGCSGGPDSVALTHVLARVARELGITLVVASVDHGLRASAAGDVEHARSIAEALELPFRALRVEVAQGSSVQARARAARYEALRRLAAAEGARRIAVGHTQDDQAETVLSRVMRGAGLEGLSGIAPRRRDGVVRPLIDCRRTEVAGHLAHHGLAAREDPSNADRKFERARIRHDLLPALERENPHLVAHLAAVADDARAAAKVVRAAGRGLLAAARTTGGVRVDELARGSEAGRRAALRAWIAETTGARAGRAHLTSLDRVLFRGGEVLLPGGFVARAREGLLIVEARPQGRSTRRENR